MKKKILKWVLIILTFLIVLYFVHSLITAKVYFDIYTAMKEKVNSIEDFYSKVEIPTDNINYSVAQEYIIKDNIFIHQIQRINNKTKDVVTLKKWQKYSEGEGVTGYFFVENTENNEKTVTKIDVKDAKEPENKMYRYDISRSLVMGVDADDFFTNKLYTKEYTYSKILLAVIKHPTILYSKTIDGEKCYAIKYVMDMGNYLYPMDSERKPIVIDYFYLLFYGNIEYVSKETKLPVAVENVVGNVGRTKVDYFSKEITEEDIKLPNLEEYELMDN